MELEEEHHKILLENLSKLQQSGLFADVVLIVNDKEYQAHRHIIACHSPYFHAMFTSNMLESSAPVIKISGVVTHGFDLLLRYMYSGKLVITEDNARDVFDTASYLQIEPVIQQCLKYFESNVSMDNIDEIMEIVNIYHLESLKTTVFNMVSRKIMKRQDAISKLNADMILYTVSRDIPICGREVDLLKVVLSWLLNGSNNEINQKESSAHAILKHIRYEEISYKSFQELILKYFPSPCTRRKSLQQTIYSLYEAAQKGNMIETDDRRSMRGMQDAILRIGGFTLRGLTNEIRYSFVDDREWRLLTTIPSVTQCNYGTAVLDNQLYIVGGCFNQHLVEVVHPSSFRYDPWCKTWERIATISVDRCRFTLTAMNNKLYAVGGTTLDDGVTNTAECYDVQTDTWKLIESLPECRQQHAAVTLTYKNSNLLFVSGGLLNETVIASMFMYNEDAGTWVSCAPLLAPRTDHVMFTYKNEIYVYGGWYTEPGVSIWSRWLRTQVTTIDAYSIKTNTWRHVTTVPKTRYHENAVLHGSKLYIIGGFYRWNVYDKHTTVDCFDFEAGTWSSDVKNEQDFWEHANALMKIPIPH